MFKNKHKFALIFNTYIIPKPMMYSNKYGNLTRHIHFGNSCIGR